MSLTFIQKLSITAHHRKEWYRALAKIAGDGLPLFEALERMTKEFGKIKHPLTPLVDVVLLRMRGAGTSKAGNQRRTIGTELMGMVPDREAMLIQSGDLSGNMAAGFANAADLVEANEKLSGSMVGALLKPVGYLGALILLMVFFSIKLMPSFEKSKPRAQWPSSAQLLGTVADNVYWISGGIVSALVLGAILLAWIVPNWKSELREKFDRHVFPFNLIAALHGASFLKALSGYIGAGTPFVAAAQNIRSTARPYMHMQCGKLLELMRNGMRAEDALTKLSIIAPRYHWIISVYGMSGDTAHAYTTIAEEMIRSVQAFINTLFNRVIGNVLMLLVGGMLFWIYSSMFGIANSRGVGL